MTAVNTVCLCGSTKFLRSFEEANVELTKRGFSVISISMALPRGSDGSEEDEAMKEVIDLVHFNKILRSDAILVVGPGYIGRSTAREILWAHMHGKPVVAAYRFEKWDDVARDLRRRISTVSAADAEEALREAVHRADAGSLR